MFLNQQELNDDSFSIQKLFSENGSVGINYLHIIAHLFSFYQSLCRETESCADRLCEEIRLVTKGSVQLVLHRSSSQQDTSPDFAAASSFPIQFRQISYGMLFISAEPSNPSSPAIPFIVAHILSQMCSYFLYTLEQSVFVQSQCKQAIPPVNWNLTRREHEILTLMGQGYNKQAVAKKLCISPATVRKHLQHVYEELNVHNEQDLRIVAYKAGLCSLLESTFQV